MVLLVYPLKDSLPNSSAILSYKLKMQQFAHSNVRDFNRCKANNSKCQPKIVLQKEKKLIVTCIKNFQNNRRKKNKNSFPGHFVDVLVVT